MSKPAAQILLYIIVVAVLCILTGCAFFQKHGFIKSGNVSVAAVGDAGKPGELHTSDKKESLPIPAGSKITVTKTEAVPATDKTAFRPATEVTEIAPNGNTEWQKFDTSVNANTGTVDTSVALKKVEAGESRPLLYAAIGAALMAGFFVWRAYPTPAIACGAASVVFFLAWKVSGLPDYFWGIGAAALAIAGGLYLGYERAEKQHAIAAVLPVVAPPPIVIAPTPPIVVKP